MNYIAGFIITDNGGHPWEFLHSDGYSYEMKVSSVRVEHRKQHHATFYMPHSVQAVYGIDVIKAGLDKAARG